VSFDNGVRPLHYHDRACLSIMLRGSLNEHIAGRLIELSDGGVFLRPIGEPHVDELASSLQVVVEPDESVVARLGERSTLFDEIHYSRSLIALGIAGRIARELQARDPFTTLAVEGLTLELLSYVLRAGRGPEPTSQVPEWVQRVREQITFDEGLRDVASLAAEVDVHPAYLARVFRRRYGQSIGQFIREARLDRAARQLVETADPISSIAFRAGFADQSHLTRAFRARWGVTPRQYRLSARDGNRSRHQRNE
jgi:AraC family transcriptional regulator